MTSINDEFGLAYCRNLLACFRLVETCMGTTNWRALKHSSEWILCTCGSVGVRVTGECRWTWQWLTLGRANRPSPVTRTQWIPVKNTFRWCAFVFCVCEIMCSIWFELWINLTSEVLQTKYLTCGNKMPTRCNRGFFTADLTACSICFGHHYAHHQELKSIIQLLLPVVFGAVKM